MLPAIIVHGGAWSIPDSQVENCINGVKLAVSKGYGIIRQNGSALDAVEKAITCLEDDPTFDAGKGSVLNAEGHVEMDAIIMEGLNLKSGAVASVQNINNPIQLARMVIDYTDHVLLVGAGANKFARRMGIEEVNPIDLVTEAAYEEWEQFQLYNRAVNTLFKKRAENGHETVGAVAIDSKGLIACGTSTGGITSKMMGRVGDSPIIGCGAYCDNSIGGVSCTGHGESIMKVCLAHRIIEMLKRGSSPDDSSKEAINFMKDRVGGHGGVIVINSDGEIGFNFSTKRMAWASAKNDTISFGINPEETFNENLN